MEPLQKKYCLAPGLRLRREEFGGTFYHHKTGKITFLYSKEAMDFLEHGGEQTVTTKLAVLLESLREKGLIQQLD